MDIRHRGQVSQQHPEMVLRQDRRLLRQSLGDRVSIPGRGRAGAPTVNYGLFLNTIFDFVIVAFVLFLLIRQVNRMQRPQPAAAPATKDCPYCLSTIPIKAVRCPNCTSELRAA